MGMGRHARQVGDGPAASNPRSDGAIGRMRMCYYGVTCAPQYERDEYLAALVRIADSFVTGQEATELTAIAWEALGRKKGD